MKKKWIFALLIGTAAGASAVVPAGADAAGSADALTFGLLRAWAAGPHIGRT